MNVESQLKILVVDDDPLCLKVVESLLLENYDCEVELADSVEEALNRINELSIEREWKPRWYDIVFMDINLPILNGDVVTKIIKQAESNMRDIPVIAITNEATAQRKDEFHKAGIADIIIKPITLEKIAPMMTKHLKV